MCLNDFNMKKIILIYIKMLFFALILLVTIFSCERNKNTERNDTENNISALSNKYHEQKQYDDESEFESEPVIDNMDEIIGVSIIGYKGNKKTVHIPSEINSLPVITIERDAFRDKQLVGVTIPDSVESIKNYAFYNNKLTAVIIPDNVRYIGESAFENNLITDITIPESIMQIYKNAFNKNQLTAVIIPDNVRYIGEGAFENNLITNATLGNNIEKINQSVFANNKLKSITIPENVTDIESMAFDENQLTAIVVTSRFSYEKDSFPNAFSGFFALNGKKPGTYTWDGKSWSVVFSTADPKDFKIEIKRIGLWDDDKATVFVSYYKGNDTDIVIPSKIQGYPVAGIDYIVSDTNKKITGVTIPDSVKSIGSYAFLFTELTGVIIPDSVIYIGYKAFYDGKLTSVTLGNNLKSISRMAFCANKLTNVVIPDSITKIEERAFGWNQLADVTISKKVTVIDRQAFFSNKLTMITIPDSVIRIGEEAFSANQLTDVIIGKNVTEMEAAAFFDNPVKSITIPGNVNLIAGQIIMTENGLVITRSDEIYPVFPFDFDKFYNANGKKAGTYTRDGKNWRKK